ncbi:MAG: magnesium chelatase, partial [Cyanobacteria bacterium P01_E01_bin.34]
NAHMQSRHLREWCRLETDSHQLLEGAIRKLGLSARGTDRLLKVSRTIADLAEAGTIGSTHIAEAIQYRSLDRVA